MHCIHQVLLRLSTYGILCGASKLEIAGTHTDVFADGNHVVEHLWGVPYWRFDWEHDPQQQPQKYQNCTVKPRVVDPLQVSLMSWSMLVD